MRLGQGTLLTLDCSPSADSRPRKDRTSRRDRGAANVAEDHTVSAGGHRDKQQVSRKESSCRRMS
jgi:hypothetical protein